ncbi:MAG: helix-turn-helix domain-containing protein [Verrucomicrobia bacterium]|nr:helix-turn-helix domain-containing protein [Verrucomicrobiota bacterium]
MWGCKILEPENIFLDHSGFISLTPHSSEPYRSSSIQDAGDSNDATKVSHPAAEPYDPTTDPTGKPITLADLERKQIFKALAFTDNNKTKAADVLGISIRTLRNKLNEYKENGTTVPDLT